MCSSSSRCGDRHPTRHPEELGSRKVGDCQRRAAPALWFARLLTQAEVGKSERRAYISYGHSTWLNERQHRMPVLTVPYGLVPMVARAGQEGLTRKEIGHAAKMDATLLDQLLAALVSTGQLTVGVVGDERVYRAVAGMGTLA